MRNPGRPRVSAAEEDVSGGTMASTSVDNALRLLRLVGERQALRVAEAADLLGVARSTAHRLLTALRRRGFVMQDRPNGAYRPGPALHEIGLAAISRIDLRRLARPVLEDLCERTKETVSLAILEGTMVRFIDCVESPRSVRVGNRTGIMRAAHAAAVGKAVLANLPDSDLARRYPGPQLPPGAEAALSTVDQLRVELTEVRAQGFAVNWEESAEGVCAVGVALRERTGTPLAGLGVAAPTSRFPDVERLKAFVPLLQEAARTIEQRMEQPE